MESIINVNNAEFLNSVIDAISEPVFVKDDKHNMVLINNAYTGFFGIEKNEIIGKNDYDFFPKEQVDVFWKKDDEVLKTGNTVVNEEKITNANKEIRTIVTTKSLYIDDKKNKYIVGVIRDITDMTVIKKIAEKHAQEIENMNKSMLAREIEMIDIKKQIDTLKSRLHELTC